MTLTPQGIRRNTLSGSGEGSRPATPGQLRQDGPQPGERRDTRGEDSAEALRRMLGENFRDVDDAQRVLPISYRKICTMVYTEPMPLALPSEPKSGILAIRVRKIGQSEQQPMLCAAAVHFYWDGVQSRAMITNIDGLTPDGSQYLFNFLVVD